MPSRDQVLLSTVRRGVEGVEELVDDLFSFASGRQDDRARQIEILRGAPCVTEAAELKTLYHDVNRSRPFVINSGGRFVTYITTTVGNDNGHVSRFRRVTESDRDAV